MDRQFPIGRFEFDQDLGMEPFVERLSTLPQRLNSAWNACDASLRDLAYRPGGWARATVVHHIADSHLNMYVRIKLALTEEDPEVKPYDENAWAELADGPAELSLPLIESVHARLLALLRSLNLQDWDRCYYHPELLRLVSLREVVQKYAWHGDHHLAHIQLPPF